MGYPVSNLYNNKIYSEDAIQTLDILANNKKIEYIRKSSFKDDIFESDFFSLGSAISSEVKLEVDNDILDEIGEFNEISLQTSLLIDEDNNVYETIPINSYIVKNKDTSAKEYTKLTLYDYMDKLNVVFDASNIIPCTRYELLKAICDYCNLELANKSILNGDVIVNVYDNTLLAKTYVSFIAERAGGFAKVIRDKLYIRNFNELDEHILPSELGGEHTTNDLKIITKVVYENGIQKFEKGTDDGEIIHLSQESPFSCTQTEVDNIYNELNGLKFQSLDVKIWGNPAIDTGDKIKYKGIASFAQKDWSWGNGFYGSYKTILNKTDKISTVSKVSANNKIKSIKSNIDEIEGKISIIAKEVDETTEQVSNLSLEVDKINSSVSSVENKVVKVEQSVPKYQVELDIYNITIPVDSSNKPLENKLYSIGYKTTFEGNEVESNVSSQSSNAGITFGLSNNQITLSVLTSNAISNLSNEFIIDFNYTKEKNVYEISKKVIVTLAVKGNDGAKGEQGIQGPQGEKGETGSTGTSGKSIGSIINYYLATSLSSNVTTSTSGWTTTVQNVSAEKKYLWNYEIVKYSDGTVVNTTNPCIIGSYGDKGETGSTGATGAAGTNGKDGTNGKSSYIHIRYSNDGSTFTDNNGKDVGRYIGSYVDYIETDSTTFSDYSWQDTAIVVEEEIDNLQEQINDTNKDLNNNYTNNQELNQKLEEQKQTITEEYSTLITQTKESWQASVINYINTNGVEKFVNTLVTIDIDGLKLSKSDEDIVSLLNNKGLYVSDGKLLDSLSNLLMKVDRAGALFKLLEVLGTIKEQEIIQKEKITDDKFGVCQAWYWIGE